MFRTIEQSFALVKKADNETAVTKYFIRNLANKKLIKTMNVGKRILIDIISLQEFLGMILVEQKTTNKFNDGVTRPDFETSENGERRKSNGYIR